MTPWHLSPRHPSCVLSGLKEEKMEAEADRVSVSATCPATFWFPYNLPSPHWCVHLTPSVAVRPHPWWLGASQRLMLITSTVAIHIGEGVCVKSASDSRDSYMILSP